jgi:hypothetical protein
MGVLWLLHGSALLHGSEARTHSSEAGVVEHHAKRRYYQSPYYGSCYGSCDTHPPNSLRRSLEAVE